MYSSRPGHDIDRGPAWIARDSVSKTWLSVTFHDKRLQRVTGTPCANFYDVETGVAIGFRPKA